MNIPKLTLLLAALCLTIPSYAQKGKAVAKVLNGSVEKNVLRTVKNAQLNYHPVFGYTEPFKLFALPSEPIMALFPAKSYSGLETRLIQTAPVLRADSENHYLQAFTRGADLTAPKLAEAMYLHRLANPTDAMPNMTTSSAYYVRFLTDKADRALNVQQDLLKTQELPALQLLEYLRKPYFVANTYAELSAIYNNAYPKHVTLNDEGIPVKTALAENATMLDRYLMLSNPNELGAFNNATQGENYTPFVLTPEEHQAANQLLSSRARTQRIPENPTPRDLIEIAYNRLESHTIPYTQAEKVGVGYQAYPNYASYRYYQHTNFYRTIKEVIEGQEPVVSEHNGIYTLENKDITHLIILDAVMGGVEPTNWRNVSNVINAFNEFSAELEKTPKNIEHIRVLQQNLRIVFDPLIRLSKTHPDPIGSMANLYFEVYRPEDLVGRNWKQHGRQFIN